MISEKSKTKDHDPYQALRHPEFRWFMLGSFALFVATQIQSVVLGWQVYELTKDPLSLGWVGLSEALPFLALTLVGGHAADRKDRRWLSMGAQSVLTLGAAFLLVHSFGTSTKVWPFYAVNVLAGFGRAFYRPASMALSTELIPKEAYGNAATWRSSNFHLALVIGPALGGLLYGFGSARLAYGVQVALMLFSLYSLFKLRFHPRPPSNEAISMLKSLQEGIRFVFRQRLLLGAMSLDLFAVLFGGAVALLPIFASDILKVGPQGLGILRAAPAVGSVLVSLWLAHHPPLQRAGRTLLICVALFGLCWIAFALSTHFGISLALLVISGATDNVSVVLRATLVQVLTPQEMMGRVSSVNAFFIGSSNELGAFESGLAAWLLGVVPSVVFGGLMTLGIVTATAWKVPELRNLREIPQSKL